MIKNKKIILLFIITSIVTFIYNYFISFLNLDEIWNYGFSYNISNGLIPYKDFNMLQTPLPFYIGSIFIKIFGHHLWSVHIFNSILVSLIIIVMYKKLNKKVLILYPIILIYSVYSYNLLCLFFIILLLNLLDKETNEYIIPLLVSIIFLTKQNIGICLFIPMIYYSKNKLKSLIIFLIPNIIFIIYLLINNCIYDYINYCFLGMLDFGQRNGIYNFILFYIFLIIYLLKNLIKTNFKNQKLFYILAFQVVAIPIIDDYHFMIGFILFLYYILSTIKIERYKYKYLLIISLSYLVIYINNINIKLDDYSIKNINLYNDKTSYLYKRNFDKKSQLVLKKITKYINDNKKDYKDNIYIFANWAYLIKLNLNENPNKYDLILNGNMGYNGEDKIINNLENKCSIEKCMFIIQRGGNQVNLKILNYVEQNYKKIDEIQDIEHNKKKK